MLTADASKFHAAEWDVCVEAAGQGAVREHAVRVLDRGRDFLCTSIGALTDDALLARLTASATANGSQLQLASGAMPGSLVTAIQTKPPESWIGARFQPGTTEQLPDVVTLQPDVATVFSKDLPERQPALKNSSVLAMLAEHGRLGCVNVQWWPTHWTDNAPGNRL